MPDELIKSRIDTADLEYHHTVVKQLESAQEIVNHWMRFISRKYNLTPMDRVNSDGTITRPELPKSTLPLMREENEEALAIDPASGK